LELEVSLKQGASEILTLQTKIIELCQIYHKIRNFST
jgi:DNA polymerase-3 subunit delta